MVSGMPSASTHFVTGIRSIAKRPGPSACVLVGLPLSASGPRFGSSALMLTWSVRWSNPQVLPGLMYRWPRAEALSRIALRVQIVNLVLDFSRR